MADEPRQPELQIVVRPIASPLPLGFFAFGTGASMVTASDLGWIPAADLDTIAIILLGFVAPLEGLAALFAFLARDAGAATTLGIFSATWIATGTTLLAAVPDATSPALGWFYYTLAAILLLLFVGSVSSKPVFAAVLALAFGRFLAIAIFHFSGADAAENVGGWIGVPLTLAAFYGGIALLLEDTMKRTVLPTGRRQMAEAAIRGGTGEQFKGIDTEAGVREQL